jgi:hypothetical protein
MPSLMSAQVRVLLLDASLGWEYLVPTIVFLCQRFCAVQSVHPFCRKLQ